MSLDKKRYNCPHVRTYETGGAAGLFGLLQDNWGDVWCSGGEIGAAELDGNWGYGDDFSYAERFGNPIYSIGQIGKPTEVGCRQEWPPHKHINSDGYCGRWLRLNGIRWSRSLPPGFSFFCASWDTARCCRGGFAARFRRSGPLD